MGGVEGAEGAATEADVVRAGARPEAAADEAVAGLLGVGDGRVPQRGSRAAKLLREHRAGGRVERLVGLRLVGDVLRLDALDLVTVQIGERVARTAPSSVPCRAC